MNYFYGKVIDVPRLNRLEKTSEIFFDFIIKQLDGTEKKVAITHQANNNYELYKIGQNIKITGEYWVNPETNENYIKEYDIEFISRLDLIDIALTKHKKSEISLDDFIRVCKENYPIKLNMKEIRPLERESVMENQKEYSKMFSESVEEEFYTEKALDVLDIIQNNLSNEDRIELYNKETGLTIDVEEDMNEFWDWIDSLDSDELENLNIIDKNLNIEEEEEI